LVFLSLNNKTVSDDSAVYLPLYPPRAQQKSRLLFRLQFLPAGTLQPGALIPEQSGHMGAQADRQPDQTAQTDKSNHWETQKKMIFGYILDRRTTKILLW